MAQLDRDEGDEVRLRRYYDAGFPCPGTGCGGFTSFAVLKDFLGTVVTDAFKKWLPQAAVQSGAPAAAQPICDVDDMMGGGDDFDDSHAAAADVCSRPSHPYHRHMIDEVASMRGAKIAPTVDPAHSRVVLTELALAVEKLGSTAEEDLDRTAIPINVPSDDLDLAQVHELRIYFLNGLMDPAHLRVFSLEECDDHGTYVLRSVQLSPTHVRALQDVRIATEAIKRGEAEVHLSAQTDPRIRMQQHLLANYSNCSSQSAGLDASRHLVVRAVPLFLDWSFETDDSSAACAVGAAGGGGGWSFAHSR